MITVSVTDRVRILFRETKKLTVLFGLAMNRGGLDTVTASRECQYLHAVVGVFFQTVKNRLARSSDLGVL